MFTCSLPVPLPITALCTSAFLCFTDTLLAWGPLGCLEKLCFQGKHGVGALWWRVLSALALLSLLQQVFPSHSSFPGQSECSGTALWWPGAPQPHLLWQGWAGMLSLFVHPIISCLGWDLTFVPGAPAVEGSWPMPGFSEGLPGLHGVILQQSLSSIHSFCHFPPLCPFPSEAAAVVSPPPISLSLSSSPVSLGRGRALEFGALQ